MLWYLFILSNLGNINMYWSLTEHIWAAGTGVGYGVNRIYRWINPGVPTVSQLLLTNGTRTIGTQTDSWAFEHF